MSQPSSPLDLEAVQRLIQQAAEKEKGYLEFAQQQSERDRAYFEHLFKRAVWFLGFLLAASAAVVAGFGIHTVSELRDEMRATTRKELQKTQKEVQDRIEAEFQTPRIHDLVQQVAKDITEREAGNLIKQAVNAKVAQEVNQRMAVFDRSLTTLGELADMGMRMRIGLRSGLADLTARAKSADSESERRRAGELLARITADYEAVSTVDFQQNLGASPATAATVAGAPPRDQNKPVPSLVYVIRSRRQLDYVAVAFIALRKATGQPFTMFDFAQVERWCKEKAPACE
jgi:hypothetical protein